MSKNLVLVTVTGKDHPGITAQLTRLISQYSDYNIIDIGQSLIHGTLSLSLLVKLPKTKNKHQEIENKMRSLCQNLEMTLSLKFLEEDYNSQSGDKYILSCVANKNISAGFIADISEKLADNTINIQQIFKTSPQNFHSLEIATSAQTQNLKWEKVKADLITISNAHQVDMALIKDDIWRRNKRLIVFDMDSTLIQSEVIVEMAKVHGVGDEVHRITEEAMNGKIDFDESLTRRVKLLSGLKESELQNILSKIKLTDGVEDFIKKIQNLGYKTAIISGGFQYFANSFKQRLGIDYAFANDLEIIDGKINGVIKGSIVNAEKKAMLLEVLAQQEGIKLEQVVAIGDGANDLPMLAKAGLGIAFHAKDIVRKTAQQNMSHTPMTSVLHFLGLTDA